MKEIYTWLLISLGSIIDNKGKRFEHFKNAASKFSTLEHKHFENVDNVNKLEMSQKKHW